MRKLVLLTVSIVLATLSFALAAYAWIGLNNVNSVEGLVIHASTGEELQISLDGLNFSSNLEKKDLSNVFKNVKLVDVTSLDGVSFARGGLKEGDKAIKNVDYLSFDLWFRTTQNEHYVYLINNLSNKIGFDEDKNGTYVVSKGVLFKSDFSFLYGPNLEMVHAGEEMTVYGKNAVRISLVEIKDLSNTNDQRLDSELRRVIFDPSENEERGFGQLYGMLQYFYVRTGNLNVVPPSAPKTIYHLTETKPDNPYQAQNNDSLFLELIKTNLTDSKGNPIYQGKATINIWIEGWDSDAFDGIVHDVLKIKLQFKALKKAT